LYQMPWTIVLPPQIPFLSAGKYPCAGFESGGGSGFFLHPIKIKRKKELNITAANVWSGQIDNFFMIGMLRLINAALSMQFLYPPYSCFSFFIAATTADLYEREAFLSYSLSSFNMAGT